MKKKTPRRNFHFAWVVLAGTCIVMGLARGGISNAGGLFMAPVMADLGCGAGEFMLYFSTSSIATFLFLPLAGKLTDRYDIRLLLVAGLALQAGAFALFGTLRSIWGWYILSVPMAIGAVFTTQIAGPVLIGRWFKKHNGLAMGIMMAAVGLFGAVLQPMAGRLIAGRGWRQGYMILGAAALAAGVPAVLLAIRGRPEEKGLCPLGAGESAGESASAVAASQGVTAEKARGSAAFWALALFLFFITAAASFAQHVPKYADQLGFDAAFAGGSMGFFMAGMLVGSLLLGLLSDRAGVKAAVLFALGGGMVSVLMLIFLGAQPLLFDLAVALFGVSCAAVGTLGPLLTGAVFGQKEYAKIYASAAMGMALAGIAALPGYGFVYDAAKSYIPVLWGIGVLLAMCGVCVLAAFVGKKKLVRAGLWG